MEGIQMGAEIVAIDLAAQDVVFADESGVWYAQREFNYEPEFLADIAECRLRLSSMMLVRHTFVSLHSLFTWVEEQFSGCLTSTTLAIQADGLRKSA